LSLLLLAISQPADAFKTSDPQPYKPSVGRSRISINNGWQFLRTTTNVDNVIYDTRPDMNGTHLQVLKSWILPSANDFILTQSTVMNVLLGIQQPTSALCN
jgi:beta-galactosidase